MTTQPFFALLHRHVHTIHIHKYTKTDYHLFFPRQNNLLKSHAFVWHCGDVFLIAKRLLPTCISMFQNKEIREIIFLFILEFSGFT